MTAWTCSAASSAWSSSGPTSSSSSRSICFAAVTRLGWRRTALFTVIAYVVAFAAEFSSTRIGFPFGLVPLHRRHARSRALDQQRAVLGFAVVHVPLLPRVAARRAAARAAGDAAPATSRSSRRARSPTSWRVCLTGALLMTWLDVVIDPLTVLGDRWFLGRMYYYPEGGLYFGVPLSNFAGWFLVGATTIRLFQLWERRRRAAPTRRAGGAPRALQRACSSRSLYLGILAFNLDADVLDRRAAARHGRRSDLRADRRARRHARLRSPAAAPRRRTSRRTCATIPASTVARVASRAGASDVAAPLDRHARSPHRAETRAVLAALAHGATRQPSPARPRLGRGGRADAVTARARLAIGPAARTRRRSRRSTRRACPRGVGRLCRRTGRRRRARRPRAARTAIVWEDARPVRRYHGAADALDAAATRVPPTRRWRARAADALLSSPTVVGIAGGEARRRSPRSAPSRSRWKRRRSSTLAARARHRRRFALRAILDTADVSLDGLPADLDVSWAARARLLAPPDGVARRRSRSRVTCRARRATSRRAAAVASRSPTAVDAALACLPPGRPV